MRPEKISEIFQDFYSGVFDLTYDSLPPEESRRKPNLEGEMISGEEMAEKRSRRRLIENRRREWQEEIEGRVCMEMYERTFQLSTSDDELRDESITSKIAAVNIMEVSLRQLGVDFSVDEELLMEVKIKSTGEELQTLNAAFTPKSKLDILLSAHKKVGVIADSWR